MCRRVDRSARPICGAPPLDQWLERPNDPARRLRYVGCPGESDVGVPSRTCHDPDRPAGEDPARPGAALDPAADDAWRRPSTSPGSTASAASCQRSPAPARSTLSGAAPLDLAARPGRRGVVAAAGRDQPRAPGVLFLDELPESGQRRWRSCASRWRTARSAWPGRRDGDLPGQRHPRRGFESLSTPVRRRCRLT